MDIVKALIQDRFLHAIMVGLRNDNVRHKLRSLLKNSILTDILENLVLATADECEHSNKFKGKQITISTIQASFIPLKTNPKLPNQYTLIYID